ncbi:MAG: hypothetical protein QNK20_11815 [Aureibaculum sp.]|nr:hypothetical protein [Aureibaculum sp.]
MDEMIETCATLNTQEQFNEQIFKVTAKEQALNLTTVRGTGVTR